MNLSVVICTHNPREDYLRRTFEALERQSLPKDQWELLLIDNRSADVLSSSWNLGWHPNARHIREERLGLTQARLRGIRESEGRLLLFVDDDNVLAETYIETAKMIADTRSWIGAFNGSTIGCFEVEPPEWAQFMLPQLAVRKVLSASWACMPGMQAIPSAPCGAGMVIRRAIAERYADLLQTDVLRLELDRKGSSLASAGDSDMALCSCLEGLAVGLFPELTLNHLIAPERLERAYLIRLAEGMSCSYALLQYIWEKILPEAPPIPIKPGRAEQLLRAYQAVRARYKDVPAPTFKEEIQSAVEMGRARARDTLLSFGKVS